MLDRFVRLCEIPSPTGEERAVADAVLGELRDLGIEVEEDRAAGPARAGAGNLIARIPGRKEGSLMLAAHLDTVFPDGTAAERPFSRNGDRAFGPGVSDMKGGLLAGFYAVQALQRAIAKVYRKPHVRCNGWAT